AAIRQGRRPAPREPARAQGASHHRGRTPVRAPPPRGPDPADSVPLARARSGRHVLGCDRRREPAAARTLARALHRDAARFERLRHRQLVRLALSGARPQARPAARAARPGRALQGSDRPPATRLRGRRERRGRAAAHGPPRAGVFAHRRTAPARAPIPHVAARRVSRRRRRRGAPGQPPRPSRPRRPGPGDPGRSLPRDGRNAGGGKPSPRVRRGPAPPARPRDSPKPRRPCARARAEPARRSGRPAARAAALEAVDFRRLGLVVVDEQHRFGVEQRARLRGKGEHPDLLVMTATPIPRTLALTIYGDLDVSVLDELPPGRRPVVTVARSEGKRRAIYKFLREQVAGGRQIYVVYPLVEESEALDLKAATDMARHLADDV